MKQSRILITAALGVALSSATLVGCGNQPTTDMPDDTLITTDDATTQQSQDELIAEYKKAVANAPEYKSVTIDVEEETTFGSFTDDSDSNQPDSPVDDATSQTDAESATDEALDYTSIRSVYKFDATGKALRTSAEVQNTNINDTETKVALKYISEGDAAVCVTDEGTYAGTAEQFEMVCSKGADSYIKEAIGDLVTLVDYADSIDKMENEDDDSTNNMQTDSVDQVKWVDSDQAETNAVIFYTVTLNVDKYLKSNEALHMLTQSGSNLMDATVTVGFDKNGNIVTLDRALIYDNLEIGRYLTLSDYDQTVVENMPEATKTYEDWKTEQSAKIATLLAKDTAGDGSEDTTE